MALILSGSDGLSDVDGSAATPAIRGTDTNTGIYFPAANQVALATNGTLALLVNATQNTEITASGAAGLVMKPDPSSTNNSARLFFTNASNGVSLRGSDATAGGQLTFSTTAIPDSTSGNAKIIFNQYGVGVGAATPSSGAGITFPAAQSASSDANTLDDYEEGTWTPSDGSGAGLVFTVNSATYLKVGKLVFVNMYLIYPATASTASAAIAGLPFVAQSLGYSYLAGRVQNNIGNGAVWQVSQASSVMASNPATNSGFAYTNVDYSGSFILFSGCYVSAN